MHARPWCVIGLEWQPIFLLSLRHLIVVLTRLFLFMDKAGEGSDNPDSFFVGMHEIYYAKAIITGSYFGHYLFASAIFTQIN